MKVKLQTQKQYSATVTLDALESIASNDMVASKFKAVGFSQVQVTGTGKTRTAVGRWNGLSMEVDLPKQVSNVKAL